MKYKVTMWSPQYSWVEADSKDEALLKAEEEEAWEAPHYQGEEKYDIEIITEVKTKQEETKC